MFTGCSSQGFIIWSFPRVTAEYSPKGDWYPKKHASSFYDPFTVHAAGWLVAAVSIGIEPLQWSVVRGEGVLVQANQFRNCLAGKVPDVACQIAHWKAKVYSKYTMETVVTLTDVFQYLEITVAVLLIVVLYHILFITVGVRKILRRIETITNEIQEVIMKPMNVADHILEGIVKYMDTQGAAPKKGDKKAKAKKKK